MFGKYSYTPNASAFSEKAQTIRSFAPEPTQKRLFKKKPLLKPQKLFNTASVNLVGVGAFDDPKKQTVSQSHYGFRKPKLQGFFAPLRFKRDVVVGVPRNAQSKFWGFSCAPSPTNFPIIHYCFCRPKSQSFCQAFFKKRGRAALPPFLKRK